MAIPTGGTPVDPFRPKLPPPPPPLKSQGGKENEKPAPPPALLATFVKQAQTQPLPQAHIAQSGGSSVGTISPDQIVPKVKQQMLSPPRDFRHDPRVREIKEHYDSGLMAIKSDKASYKNYLAARSELLEFVKNKEVPEPIRQYAERLIDDLQVKLARKTDEEQGPTLAIERVVRGATPKETPKKEPIVQFYIPPKKPSEQFAKLFATPPEHMLRRDPIDKALDEILNAKYPAKNLVALLAVFEEEYEGNASNQELLDVAKELKSKLEPLASDLESIKEEKNNAKGKRWKKLDKLERDYQQQVNTLITETITKLSKLLA